MDIKQYVVDFIEERVDVKDFLHEIKNNPSIFDWLQSLIPEGEMMQEAYYDYENHKNVIVEIPYTAKGMYERLFRYGGETNVGNQLNLHHWVYKLVQDAFPQEHFEYGQTLNKKFNFMLEACPEYLLSTDIESSGILEELLEEFPETMPKTKRIKAFKEKLKGMFFIEGQKYPRWIQASEWPLSKTGKPTKFLRQKSKGEISFYYFLDVDTNEEIEIMQAY